MPKRRYIFMLVSFYLSVFLISCSSTPSEADGWEYDSETESYIRETYFSRDDEITKEYLKQLEGTFTAEEDSSVGIIVENNEILVGIGTGSNVYPVEYYELFLWETYKEDSEEITEIYIVVLSPPEILADVVTRLNMYTIDKDLSARENPIFLFKVLGAPSVAGDYYMNRSNVGYSRVPNESSRQNKYQEESEEVDSKRYNTAYRDGTYQATVDGHNGPLTVEVTIIDGTIAKVNVIDHEETRGLADPAIEEVPDAIVKNNSTNVDTVTAATVTSEAIIEAVDLIIGASNSSSKKNSNRRSDEINNEEIQFSSEKSTGTYEVTVEGYQGPITVEVTVKNSVITKVIVTNHNETEGLADRALVEIPEAIIQSNSTNVDIISGATFTSQAIIEAVIEAKIEAKNQAEGYRE